MTYEERQAAARTEAAKHPAPRDSRQFWYCNACHAQNSREDGTCQYCECGGADCARDNCDDARHFEPENEQIEDAISAHVAALEAEADDIAARVEREAEERYAEAR